MGTQWIEIFAGMKNPGMRHVLGLVLCGQQEQLPEDRTTTKNLERWEKIGLLRQGPGWELNEQLLTSALRARARPKPEGVQRFFNGPRLLSLPAKPAERHEVLRQIRDAAIGADEELSEERLNDRLRTIHPDVALLRRYMVDSLLLERSANGSAYRSTGAA